ncbi:MAG: GNAT family N-acetyltransferase, partial [Nocardioides sp.]
MNRDRPITPLRGVAGGDAVAVLRPARRSDLPDLLRMVHELAAYEREPDAVQAVEADFEKVLFPAEGEPTAFAEVAEVDERLVAMALWYLTFSTWTGRNGIWLEDLYVDPAQRGTGIGRAMLARLAEICVARGYPRLEWWVLGWNQPAIDFYSSLGARGMPEWTHYRMERPALGELGA